MTKFLHGTSPPPPQPAEKIHESHEFRSSPHAQEHGAMGWPASARPSVEEILRAVRITSRTRELDLSYARGLTAQTLETLLICLPSLRKLTMRHTDLNRLPDAFAHLPELQELDLSFNAFTALPPSLGTLSKLQHLSVHNNRLQNLPPSLGRLHALRLLNASNNRLSALGPEIRSLKNLRVLRLASNRLTEIHPGLGELPQLHLLQLSFNRLSHLPPQLGQLRTLKVLSVAFNALDTLPQSFERLVDLVYLDLTGNDLTALPAYLSPRDNLRVRGFDDPTPPVAGEITVLTGPKTRRSPFLWASNSDVRSREVHLSRAEAAFDAQAVTAINGWVSVEDDD